MRRGTRIVLGVALLLALASCSPRHVRQPSAPVAPRWPREWVLPSASAYGDTVWLGSDRPERLVTISGATGPDAHATPRPGLTIFARTEGTPLAIRVPERLADRTARQLVDGALAREDLHLSWWNDPDVDSLATQEAGRYEEAPGTPSWGWDAGFPLEPAARYRVIVVVFGHADRSANTTRRAASSERWSLTRTEDDPLPLQTGRAVRPFEPTHTDRFATMRVVADYDVDLVAMRVTYHVTPGATRRWHAKSLR